MNGKLKIKLTESAALMRALFLASLSSVSVSNKPSSSRYSQKSSTASCGGSYTLFYYYEQYAYTDCLIGDTHT
jgi:hypothetical protein